MQKEFINPIDKEKVAETPGLIPFAHNIGSAIIKPIDEGKTKGIAMRAMYEQSDIQLQKIKRQVESLLKDAQEIHDRIRVSEEIYNARITFKPIIGHTYYFYKKDDKPLLSIISPGEWNGKCPYHFEATVKLLADHTWQVVD